MTTPRRVHRIDETSFQVMYSRVDLLVFPLLTNLRPFDDFLLGTNGTVDVYSLMEQMRAHWTSIDEPDRLSYLDSFQTACEQYLPTLDTQLQSLLHRFFVSILDLLHFLTSSELDLTIRMKLVLATSLAWLIKHAQLNFCRSQFKPICALFKSILLHGQANNRQLAVGLIPRPLTARCLTRRNSACVSSSFSNASCIRKSSFAS